MEPWLAPSVARGMSIAGNAAWNAAPQVAQSVAPDLVAQGMSAGARFIPQAVQAAAPIAQAAQAAPQVAQAAAPIAQGALPRLGNFLTGAATNNPVARFAGNVVENYPKASGIALGADALSHAWDFKNALQDAYALQHGQMKPEQASPLGAMMQRQANAIGSAPNVPEAVGRFVHYIPESVGQVAKSWLPVEGLGQFLTGVVSGANQPPPSGNVGQAPNANPQGHTTQQKQQGAPGQIPGVPMVDQRTEWLRKILNSGVTYNQLGQIAGIFQPRSPADQLTSGLAQAFNQSYANAMQAAGSDEAKQKAAAQELVKNMMGLKSAANFPWVQGQ